MDGLLPGLLDELALEGADGCSLDRLWTLAESVHRAPLDDAARVWLWQALLESAPAAVAFAASPSSDLVATGPPANNGSAGGKRKGPAAHVKVEPGAATGVVTALLTGVELRALKQTPLAALAARWPYLRIVASEDRRNRALGQNADVRRAPSLAGQARLALTTTRLLRARW